MVSASKLRLFFLWRGILRGIFFILYFSIKFFITIGELTVLSLRFLLVTPIMFFWRNKGIVTKGSKKTVSLIGTFFLLVFRTISKVINFIILLPFRFIASLFSPELKFFLLGIALCFTVFFLFSSYRFVVELPSPTDIGKLNYPLSTHMYDRNGKLLYEIYKDQNRTLVQLKDLPKYIYQATIAIEDKDFYSHSGVSLLGGILRAAKETLLKKGLQGGSTITQQLVKSALLTPERTIERKLKEILLALWTEKLYSKNKILEMYLNQVPYGGSSYGIEEAAKTYFGKHAKELSIQEAAFLAGMPQAPSVYSPYTNPDLAKKRRNEVLKKMYELGFITKGQKESASNEAIGVTPLRNNILAPHFVFYVKSDLEKQYGLQRIEEGGLNVITSLDLDIQQEAEKIVNDELEKVASLNISNAAILVTKPETGEILAMVGSVDYFAEPSGAFNVITGFRQPGSSIKPVTYAMALENGYTAATILDDVPTAFGISGGAPYVPVNYDGRFHGRVPLRYALANSFNIPAVKLLNTFGVEEMVSLAKKMGITTWDDSSRFGLSLTLGGGEVHMTDMATVFGTLANQGERVAVTGVKRIYDARNETLFDYSPKKKRVVSKETSYILSDILSDNFARRWEFGTRSALEIPGYKVAVKTGTTDMKKDNWTIGYTPDFVVTVWVGNNDNTPMDQYLASGITGAAPIWNRMMSYLLTKYGAHWYEKPPGLVEKQCYFGKTEYFVQGTESKANCSSSILGTVNVTPTKTP
ncbi:penicillin-binding protein [Candidatus Roizmanbacteria bacterium CG03_land_8_20_14_0_80_39_12]|uniref:Penicillin-binding protein n=1 Tax=Candidatus Roizmanbacteria bacterium CG03_land_8_20_14_0_80_39_12 TaxID=1974847 RepID=A0A2M7BS97_9BACT|nr:MAG: penicillin-binding protein [Candidatus Roizmanbacteria bacterium CG03_land_8_20_14_0_80_39_12]